MLGCDVLIPVRAGKHPAAVLVPGAGANDRYALYMIAELFAEHGIATLACDKRGIGKSEGDWRLASFEQQAQDVAAGVRFLQQRTEIDATRVGVFGLSEGAWVAPITAAQNPRLAFLILAALPAMSRRDSVLIGNVERLRREGTSPLRSSATASSSSAISKQSSTMTPPPSSDSGDNTLGHHGYPPPCRRHNR
jgi:predicted acyl esterase